MMKRLLLVLLVMLTALPMTLAAGPALARPAVLSITVDHGVPLVLKGSAASVFIANPDIADVQVMSPGQVMIFGKRTGETSFMATNDKGETLAERTVVVSQDLSGLRQELDVAIPGNRIKASPVPNGIILTGVATDSAAVSDAYKIAMRYMPPGGDIINRVQISGSNQVQIRVRFAEVQRNIDNSLGFNWQNLGSVTSGFTFGLATGVTGLGSGTSILSNRPSNSSLNLPNDVLGASIKAGNFSIDAVIDALAQDGLISILAEPNLTAMSGETANFLAGGEFPIPIPQGNGTISIEFKPYGVSLAFTPTLLSGDRISLHVRPEVSELTQTGSIVVDNITVPALLTRKAETTVEVSSGQSFAIAGLIDNSQAQTVDKFPLLGDMPILGALFRSSHFQNGQTELVVIITPYIVKPTGERLALPTDGLAPPSELDRLGRLRMSASDPDARPMSGDPTAVLAAPVAPVTTSDETPQLTAPAPTAISPMPTQSPDRRSSPVPAMTPPVVLHPASDSHANAGGLLVE
ncbi:MAG: type II and III secretion system protein family protein [Alphaproteobacteria bacterium]|nr:type II and III secretion system protein family protein [Alphaproteobacteria bacterium]